MDDDQKTSARDQGVLTPGDAAPINRAIFLLLPWGEYQAAAVVVATPDMVGAIGERGREANEREIGIAGVGRMLTR